MGYQASNDSPDSIPDEDRITAGYFMDKHNYNHFVSTLNVSYPKGMVVSLKMFPYVPNQAPPLFTVESYQEMRHLAEWCSTYKQPRTIFLRAHTGISQFVAPKAIRFLTEDEKQFANVLNPKTEESGAASDESESRSTDSLYAG
jgi:hypothetical protein